MMLKATTVITNWVYAVVRITLVWWMANFPYLFLLLAAFTVTNEGQVGTILLLGLLLVPFVLMPGTIGALGIGREFFKHGNEFPLFSSFFKYYKREYMNGLKFGSIFVGIMGVLYVAYSYYSSLLGSLFGLVFMVFMCMAIFFFLILLTIVVDRVDGFTAYFNISRYFIGNNPLLLILLVFKIILTICFCGVVMPSLLVFVCPGIIVLLVTHFYMECLKREEERNTLITNESEI